jgi:hypothetical protein
MALAISSLPVPDSPTNQHVGIRIGHAFDDFIDGLHRFAAADDVEVRSLLRQLAAQLQVLLRQPPAFERLFEQELQFVKINRLFDEVVAPALVASTALVTEP